MAAIDESLWIGYDDADNLEHWVARYNIAKGVYTPDVYEWGSSDTFSTHGACWDGAYHLWIQHTHSAGKKFKRINLFDESVADWPVIPDWTSGPKALGSDYFTGILLGAGLTGLGNYSYATKSIGTIPENASQSTDGTTFCTSPPWATYSPGCIFSVSLPGSNLYFWKYSYLTGWSQLADVPVGPGYGNMVWADGSGTEYVYKIVSAGTDGLRKYNVNTNTWSIAADCPSASGGTSIYAPNVMTWDGDNYLYWLSSADDAIFRFNCTTESWDSYLSLDYLVASKLWLVYTPRIRFMFLNQDGVLLDSPMSLGSVPKDRISTGVKYYIRALEGEAGTVTLGIINDARGDADDILEIAPDSGGQPGAWGSSANLGSFSSGQETPFWIRCDPGAGTTQEAKIARLQLSIT